MFWIGFIVGIATLFLISGGIFMFCLKVTGTSWEDFTNLVEANEAALINRESQIQVWHNDEQVFEATFAYPWGDNVEE